MMSYAFLSRRPCFGVLASTLPYTKAKKELASPLSQNLCSSRRACLSKPLRKISQSSEFSKTLAVSRYYSSPLAFASVSLDLKRNIREAAKEEASATVIRISEFYISQYYKAMSELNATSKVRLSSDFIKSKLGHLKINLEKLEAKAEWVANYKYDGFEESSNHPSVNELDLEKNLLFIFLVDALNFCFWPQSLEYEDLSEFVLKGIKQGTFDLEYFLGASFEEFKSKFEEVFKTDPYCQMEQRYFNAREMCMVVEKKFGSSFYEIIRQSNFDAEQLLEIIVQNFTSFQDHCIYKGRLVYFYKRAQILVADVNEVLKIQHKSDNTQVKILLEHFDQHLDLKNIGQLTCFADYRVPQVLHYFGILEYSQLLENKISKGEQLACGGEEEVEIRGAMIYCISYLCQYIKKKFGKEMKEIEIDWILWQYGEKQIKDSHPFHKTLGVFY